MQKILTYHFRFLMSSILLHLLPIIPLLSSKTNRQNQSEKKNYEINIYGSNTLQILYFARSLIFLSELLGILCIPPTVLNPKSRIIISMSWWLIPFLIMLMSKIFSEIALILNKWLTSHLFPFLKSTIYTPLSILPSKYRI